MSELDKRDSEDRMHLFKVQGSRRNFLAYSGATIAVSGLILSGCSDEENNPLPIGDLKAPTNFRADSTITAGVITLTWVDNSIGEDGFHIERSLNKDSGFQQIAQVGEDVASYIDRNIEENTPYFYRVRVFRGNEISSFSSVASTTDHGVYLGTGDVGILNYAYALEQLEAAFYTQVLAGGYYASANEEEKQILLDLKKHEVIHREFLKAALTAVAPDDIIPALEVDFSSINFDDRMSVLGTAMVFEDLGVSAYNGAGQFLETPAYLTLAGKIVSVEGRHASAIRDLLNPNSMDFAGGDIVNDNGLEVTRSIPEVLGMASAFITTPLDASGLPTNGFQIPLP